MSFIEIKSVTKLFGEFCANDSVTFNIEKESFHGIVGENGAGKSTIVKILYGLFPPTSGEIQINGEVKIFKSATEAIQCGIGMVHQHFMLVPTLQIWENIILGIEPTLSFLPKERIIQEIDSLQKEFGFNLKLTSKVSTLPLGLQQQIEILKVLYRKASTIILDEPTAVLTPQEVDILFTRLRQLKEQGKTIIVITHKLREILQYTDSVTVMRQGKVIESTETKNFTLNSLAEKIIGKKPEALQKIKIEKDSPIVLEVKNLSFKKNMKLVLDGINFHIKTNEIVGIAGIEGNGQHELIEVISNVSRIQKGTILFNGINTKRLKTRNLKELGLAIIPPDRQQEGLILNFSVKDNLLLGKQRALQFQKKLFLDWRKIMAASKKLIQEFDIRPTEPQKEVSKLSGGNQQKVIIARETSPIPKVLLACHPTRGVDIGAIEFIHNRFLKLREQGSATLLISSDIDEILALADRILVIFQGKIVGETTRENATEKQLGLWMTGATEK